MPTLDRTAAINIAKSFLDCFSTMDFQRASSLMTDDAVVAFPYNPSGADPMPKSILIDDWVTSVPQFLKSVSFTIESEYYDPETGFVILEYHSSGIRVDGAPYGNDYISIWELKGDKIRVWREYFNPAKLG